MKNLMLALVLTLAWGQANAQSAKPVTIATEGAFPPWNAVDTSGRPVGFDIDVGKAICVRAKLECEFVTQAWDGIIPALTVGKFDAIMAGMSITEKRKQVISFSEPYALTSNYFVVLNKVKFAPMEEDGRVDLTAASDGEDTLLRILKTNLMHRTIGVQGSTNAEAFVHAYLGDDVEVRTYDKQDSLNLDLVAGRIDAGLADYSVWKAFLESDEGKTAHLYGPRLSGGIFGPGVGIGLRQGDKELADAFNDGLKAIKADGTLKAISLRWFGADLVSN
jgi:octopine/nopaline transport system substrate-binding protein